MMLPIIAPISSHKQHSKKLSKAIGLRVTLILSGLLLSCLMIYSYFTFESPKYIYSGFVIREMTSWPWLMILLLPVVPLLWLPISNVRPSSYASWFLYLVVIAPAPLIIINVLPQRTEQAFLFVFILYSAFALFVFILRIPVRHIHLKPLPHYVFTVALPLGLAVIGMIIFSLAGFRINLGLFDIYERRLESREFLGSARIIGYSLAIATNAGAPLALAIGWQNRRWVLVFASLFCVIAAYSFSGNKSVLFTPVLVIFVQWLSSKRTSGRGVLILFAACIIIVISMLEQTILRSNTLSSVVVHRMLNITSQVSAYYWDFFTTNPKALMAGGLFGGLLQSPYEQPASYIIGAEYFHNPSTNANSNMWAAAYADFGIIGIYIVSIFGALLLRIIDANTLPSCRLIANSICAVIGIYWSQLALQTTLLSNGVLLLVFLLMLLPDITNVTIRKKPEISSSDAMAHSRVISA